MRVPNVTVVNNAGGAVATLNGVGVKDEVQSILHNSTRDFAWLVFATSLPTFIWTCTYGVWKVTDVWEAHTVAATANSDSPSVDVLVCPQACAIASGVTQLSAVLDITGTGPLHQKATLIDTPTEIYPGDAIAVNLIDTIADLVGCVSIRIARIK